MKLLCSHIIAFIFLIGSASQIAPAQQTRKPFTITDEIGLTLFGGRSKVLFSPDGNYFVVWTERGRLDLDRVEDSLRFYRSQDVEQFVKHSDESQSPSPVWIVDRADTNGESIHDCRWLTDSSGVAFIGHASEGAQLVVGDQLILASLRTKVIEPLTSATEVVEAFDVHDRDHYVYTAFDRNEQDTMQQKARAEAHAAAMVGTGHSLKQLLFPGDERFLPSPPIYIWAVMGGKRFEVKQNGAPVAPGLIGRGDLVLSPDDTSLVTTLPVREVPSAWTTLYPPPFASSPFRLSGGHDGPPPHQYVKIDLQTGSIKSLTDAPIASDAGWWAGGSPSWSSDSRAVLLPNTFLSSKDHVPSSPCVAVVDLTLGRGTCVERLKRQSDTNYYLIDGAVLAKGNKERVIVSTSRNSAFHETEYHATEYHLRSDGTWQSSGESKSEAVKGDYEDLKVMVKEGLDEPPLLVAQDKQRLRVIWDPNPQLKNIELGNASVYTWKDKEGRALKGGLYRPVGYEIGKRYPLVIQTHGFRESEFRPSGLLSTGSAARLLAAAGIFVLQIGEYCPLDTPDEGPCAVSNYETAANQLISEGLVDRERIGIIGFSRTCFSVMEALTGSSLHLKAALLTDGFMATYLQYIATIDEFDNGIPRQFDSMIGASPFGEGLQQWLKRSPSFNLDKITTPLLVVAEGHSDLLFMWEPYAGLRYLQKPVDLVILNTDEHVLTNPSVRLASQGGSVDWFRFWLKNEEDPNPTKAEQYTRWRMLQQSRALDCCERSH